MIGAVVAVSAIVAVVMLIGVLFARFFPLFRNFRRVYLFGAAAAGGIFLLALIVLGIQALIGVA
jgi:hypothetical protein